MTTFHLVRHAEKAGPPDVLSGRRAGVPLTGRGREQAARLAQHFTQHTPTAIYSSPLERARETAHTIADACGLAVQIHEGFHEFDFGAWTGCSFAELRGEARWKAFNERRSLAGAPGGETMLAVQHRFVHALLALAERERGGTVVVVSHADPIRAALMYFTGTPLDGWGRFAIELASISTVRLGDDGMQVVAVNATV